MQETYKIFLDDIRNVEQVFPALINSDFVVIRSYTAFVMYVKQNGLPAFISFDNDLGEDENGKVLEDGYACAKWLVYKSNIDLRELKYHVHSANPVAKKQIDGLLSNYIRHLNTNKI